MLQAPWLAPRPASTGPMQRCLRIMVPEEGSSGCPVPRLSWMSVLRSAAILSLTGIMAYCFLRVQQGQLEPPKVRREGGRRKMQTSHLLGGAWGPLGGAGSAGAQRREANHQEENGIEVEGPCVWAQTGERPRIHKIKKKKKSK